MRPEHRPLRSILIHSYMNLRFTTKAIGPREEEVSGGKQSFLSTTVKTVTLGRRGSTTPGALPDAFAFAEDSAWRRWVEVRCPGGRNEVHLKRLLEHGACLMLLSFGLSVQGSNILGERCTQTAPPSVCLCPGETRGALPASCPSLRLTISF